MVPVLSSQRLFSWLRQEPLCAHRQTVLQWRRNDPGTALFDEIKDIELTLRVYDYDNVLDEDIFKKIESVISVCDNAKLNEILEEEKDKLDGIADGAEVNYVKSVGDNLSVDADGKLTVNIPEVDVPF